MAEQMTAGEVNQRLKDAGLPQITTNELRVEITRLREKDRIMQAVQRCQSDEGARKFLQNLLTTAQQNLDRRNRQHRNAQTQEDSAGTAQRNSNTQQPPSNAHGNANSSQNHGRERYEDQRHTPANDGNAESNQPPRKQTQESNQKANESTYEGAREQDKRGRDSGESNASNQERDFISRHVYGGKAALCFEADTTRSDAHTISLDAAPTVAPRKYDWKNKTRVQMTVHELPFVTAVLMGLLPECEYKNHGPDNNKGFSMQRQDGGKVFVRVFEGDKGVKAVPVEAADVYHVASLCMRQLMLNTPWLDATGVLATLRATITPTAGAGNHSNRQRAA